MQKPNRLPWILVALLVGLNIVVLTVVWMRPPFPPPPPPHGPRHGEGPPHHGGLAGEIGLQEEAAQKMEALQAEHFRRLDSLRDQIIALRLKAFANFGTQSEDSSAARLILDQIGNVQVAIESERYRHFHEVLGLCSKEEADRFKEILPRVLSRKSQPENRPDGPPNGGPHGGPPPHHP